MQKMCLFLLKLIGWKIVGQLPNDKKYIIIVAPHTSNWDLVIGLIARFAMGVKINFLAKKQVFFFPLGILLRAMGGSPVDRSKTSNNVQQAIELFRTSEDLKLAITPEGTRSQVTRWKEGFYYISCQAGIPIVMIGFDYSSKEIRIQEPFWPSGDINTDFPNIIDYFRTVTGRYPKEIPDYHPKEKKGL